LSRRSSVLGLNGLYDLPALVHGLGARHEHLRAEYAMLLSNAFGANRDDWPPDERTELMFFVAGITGKVGGATARRLLDDGHEVRALVHDRTKSDEWSQLGVELREGDLTDASALADALLGVEGAFLMQPAPMGVSPGFPEATALNASIVEALRHSSPPRLVVLSSVAPSRPRAWAISPRRTCWRRLWRT
jgi:hypothetical protein